MRLHPGIIHQPALWPTPVRQMADEPMAGHGTDTCTQQPRAGQSGQYAQCLCAGGLPGIAPAESGKCAYRQSAAVSPEAKRAT